MSGAVARCCRNNKSEQAVLVDGCDIEGKLLAYNKARIAGRFADEWRCVMPLAAAAQSAPPGGLLLALERCFGVVESAWRCC